VFAVGLGGRHAGQYRDAFYHFDGSEWKRTDTGSFVSFTDVWAASRTSVFAVGTSVLVYRGTEE
jgi:hypothetical protein